jgi:hypothetical protein
MMNIRPIRYAALAGFLTLTMSADPVPVRHVQGFLHGYLVLRDLDDKVLASGDMTQIPAGSHVTTTLTLKFKDGSLYQEMAVFSQRRTFQLLSYRQSMKGPSFKTQGFLSLDTSSGNVRIQYDKDGKDKSISDPLSLPADLANGIIPMLLSNADPKEDNTLSMLVSTPKPRIVKLKISASGQESFSIGNSSAKAIHYIIKIDIGGLTGVAAKVVGKLPPPIHMWIAAGNAPVFLKSEGQLYEDGPIWRIELASPTWPKAPQKQ